MALQFRMRQGDEVPVSLTIVENGLPVDISSALSIKAQLLLNKTARKVYSLSPNIGEGRLEVDATNTNQVNLFIERSDSISFEVGTIDFYLLVETDNPSFPDGGQTKSYQYQSIGSVAQGFALDIPMP